ncbi:glucose-6-phosphate dehydrogenase [Coralloluteibacterium stylophorae]|uniref:Glucose-6-phosphate 1-dehydrogenase n=1 Tax=Coralloluteibacterium stylophorae TaxID=1776034 RepID=A0A8J7VWG0_9GAMM|nr:glucose-6-phosphate dehydrogenase [Coralloluteibacterium stylophorae]MBS7456146.1 glucose-6-phosphate dehydrogenase [Coralloluteibacterium stylophorae]
MHDTLLLFGATGDLAARMLFPSLAHLLRDRLLPDGFRVVAVGRQEFDPDGFREWLSERIEGFVGDDMKAREWVELFERTEYVTADLADPASIPEVLGHYAERPCVSYLATPPALFIPITQGLKAAGLLDAPSRLVLEKPLGRDLASAREINAAIRACAAEEQVFRIDHYLGKAAVQNLAALRFGNTLFEAVWSRRWIESVDIMIAETTGVDGRDGYYAKSGALRDMVQNHILQLLCLIAMEPPSALDADSVRDEKLKVLRALRPMRPADACTDVVRGRYGDGVVGGRSVTGYAPPEGTDPETFVAVRAYIDNWRWAGVPFRLVTGKRMPTRSTQVVVNFRPVSHWLFEHPRREKAAPNRLVLKLQPEEAVELGLMNSLAGPEWGAQELKPLPLDLTVHRETPRRIAYERLLLDALIGNPALFVRSDEVEAAWAFIDSVIAAWTAGSCPVHPYPAGSWGPKEAEEFLPGALTEPPRPERPTPRSAL